MAPNKGQRRSDRMICDYKYIKTTSCCAVDSSCPYLSEPFVDFRKFVKLHKRSHSQRGWKLIPNFIPYKNNCNFANIFENEDFVVSKTSNSICQNPKEYCRYIWLLQHYIYTYGTWSMRIADYCFDKYNALILIIKSMII